MSNLSESLKKLIDFAKKQNSPMLPLQTHFVESNFVQYLESDNRKIEKEFVFNFKDYEERFDELLNQGHSWINLHLTGFLEDSILIIVEFPNYKNNVPREFVSINFSLPERKIIENDWKLKSFYEITA